MVSYQYLQSRCPNRVCALQSTRDAAPSSWGGRWQAGEKLSASLVHFADVVQALSFPLLLRRRSLRMILGDAGSHLECRAEGCDRVLLHVDGLFGLPLLGQVFVPTDEGCGAKANTVSSNNLGSNDRSVIMSPVSQSTSSFGLRSPVGRGQTCQLTFVLQTRLRQTQFARSAIAAPRR